MKRNGILALAIIFSVSLSCFAQDSIQNRRAHGPKDGPRKEMKEKLSPKKRAGYLAVDLELTDAQRDKLQALYEKEDVQREKQMAEMKKIHEQQKAKMEAMKKTHETEMEKILGPEKFQQWKVKQAEKHEKMMKKMKKQRHMGEMPRGERPPMPPKDAAQKMN